MNFSACALALGRELIGRSICVSRFAAVVALSMVEAAGCRCQTAPNDEGPAVRAGEDTQGSNEVRGTIAWFLVASRSSDCWGVTKADG